MSAVVETLKAARALLTPEGAWTQGELAKNIQGDGVIASDSNAVCWCANGAIEKLSGRSSVSWSTKLALLKVKQVRRFGYITNWNDVLGRTHAEVLAAFDEAIRRAEAA